MHSVSESSIYVFQRNPERGSLPGKKPEKRGGKGHPRILLQYIKTHLSDRGGKKLEEAKEQRNQSLIELLQSTFVILFKSTFVRASA